VRAAAVASMGMYGSILYSTDQTMYDKEMKGYLLWLEIG
jgi:hypothetical protein